MAHGRRSTEAAERVWIFPRRVIVVQRDPLVVPENLVHVAMTGVELAVCQLSAVLSPIAEHAESVERIAHQVGMAVAAVRHTRTEAVIMVAPPAFRMASAGILDFMRHGVIAPCAGNELAIGANSNAWWIGHGFSQNQSRIRRVACCPKVLPFPPTKIFWA